MEAGPVAADNCAAHWRGTEFAELRENTLGGGARQKTRVRTGWTCRALRVLFSMIDSHPQATITRRDGPLWEEEVAEIFLDPFGDGAVYFEFEVNPLNTVLDLVARRIPNGYRRDLSWDCPGLETAVRITPDGWDAELSIPFQSLLTDAPRPGDAWRVNFLRIDRPPGAQRELTAWSPTFLGTFHVPERFGALTFQD